MQARPRHTCQRGVVYTRRSCDARRTRPSIESEVPSTSPFNCIAICSARRVSTAANTKPRQHWRTGLVYDAMRWLNRYSSRKYARACARVALFLAFSCRNLMSPPRQKNWQSSRRVSARGAGGALRQPQQHELPSLRNVASTHLIETTLQYNHLYDVVFLPLWPHAGEQTHFVALVGANPLPPQAASECCG